MKELEISKVLNLAKSNKYATACAAFDVVDHIFKIEVPKSLKPRKLAVQAMTLLQDGVVKYGYESKLEEAAQMNAPTENSPEKENTADSASGSEEE